MFKTPPALNNRSYSRQQFTKIVQWAAQHHPFYKTWLPSTGGEVPILTRNTILENNQILLNGHPVTATTSGSTGVPVKVSWSARRSQLDQKDTELLVTWLGGSMPRSTIIYAPGNHKPEVLDINASLAQQIQFITMRHQQFGAVAITTYPSNADQLSQYVLAQGLDMRFIRRFGCYSEVFEPYQEEQIRAAFPNAQIWSTYSAMEFGLIAARCPHEPSFHHFMAHKLGIEVLDKQGEPCENGQPGRVVITDYLNRFMPLIRYEIGDLAARDQCPCGQIGLPALSQVQGKIRGTLKHHDGRRVVFTELSVALRDIVGMRQYQVIQSTLNEFVLRYTLVNNQPSSANINAFESSVKASFKLHFGYLPAIKFQPEKEILRDPNGKFYASICKI